MNGPDASATAVALQLHGATDSSNLNLKIGQTFAGMRSSSLATRKKEIGLSGK